MGGGLPPDLLYLVIAYWCLLMNVLSRNETLWFAKNDIVGITYGCFSGHQPCSILECIPLSLEYWYWRDMHLCVQADHANTSCYVAELFSMCCPSLFYYLLPFCHHNLFEYLGSWVLRVVGQG